MDFSVSKEAFIFLCSCFCGAGIFLLYDLFRTIRKSAGAGSGLLTDVQDCLFWVLAFLLMFFMIFHINRGILRFYEILGAALGAMVANLSSHKAGWDEQWEYFSDYAERGQQLLSELLALVDEDTEAFNRIMAVFAMPKGTPEEKAARSAALQEATLYATQVPLKTMKASLRVFEIVEAMAASGNPNSVSDAGVGALAARSAVLGAQLNVRINAAGLKDRAVADSLTAEAAQIAQQAVELEQRVLDIVNEKIG